MMTGVLWRTCITILLAQVCLHQTGIKVTATKLSPDSKKDLCPKQLEGDVEVFECKCYEFRQTKTYWDNKKCEVNGGHLAKIKTKEEDSFLREKARKYFPSETGAWIGASRETEEDEFFWTDGSPVEFTNWADGEPDSIVAFSQNCVYLKQSLLWTWATLQCTAFGFGPQLPSICQYEIRNCTVGGGMDGDTFNLTTLIVIVVSAGIGAIILLLIISYIIVKCRRRYKEYHKKKNQRRSIKYYSRPPSTVRHSVPEPRVFMETHEPTENDLNEKLVRGAEAGEDELLNVKGSMLPTASSIANEAAKSSGLVVDVHTGRSTVKRINTPTSELMQSKAAAGQAHGSSQDSSDPTDPLMNMEKVSLSHSLASNEENTGVADNLDNIDKPSSHPFKDVIYK